jgi:response regulator of citrate/malate metabolism
MTPSLTPQNPTESSPGQLANGSPPVRVLVVDDESITAEAHAEYVRRLDGFEVAGIAYDGHDAVRLLRESVSSVIHPPGIAGAAETRHGSIDLILLDMNLPDTHGLDLCRRIRASGLDVDIIAITAVRDVAVVRASVSLGIVQYLIKPFTFARFAEKMKGYLEFRASFGDPAALATQSDVDQTMAALRAPSRPQLDKGLAQETLDLVTGALRAGDTGMSAAEVADSLQLSRVTARRYLEHLFDLGTVERSARYGTPGRPVLEYRWRSAAGR